MKKLKIYVASSWRNKFQPQVIEELSYDGHEVYDFRHPTRDDKGFSWSEIDPNWQRWTNEQFKLALSHSIAERGFRFDMEALKACDVCLLVLPCGRSAHLELGYAVGTRKKTVVLLAPRLLELHIEGRDYEAELMYKMVDFIALNLHEALDYIRKINT